jgi:hypothetical protein
MADKPEETTKAEKENQPTVKTKRHSKTKPDASNRDKGGNGPDKTITFQWLIQEKERMEKTYEALRSQLAQLEQTRNAVAVQLTQIEGAFEVINRQIEMLEGKIKPQGN